MSKAVRPTLVEGLEHRLLCARTPSNLRPESMGRAFDLDERASLLARLDNLPARTLDRLNRDIKRGDKVQFDTDLLFYMQNRTNAKYYFDPKDAGSIANYVKNTLNVSAQTTKANAVTDSRLFPEQSSVTSYTVQLPDEINWNDASKNSNPEFIPALNRQDWWIDLAQTYRYTGNTKYIEELKYELASWSQQNATFTLPAKVGQYTSYGFNFGLRVDFWTLAYFSVLNTDGWTGAANSLMLYKLVQQGDILNTVAANTTDFSSNRSIAIGKAEQILGEVFPEIDTSSRWETAGRKTVLTSMAAQFYPDGSHREQSPGYALNVLDDLLEDVQLDKVNGITWAEGDLKTVTNAVDALWQQLSPDGRRPGIGDTFRLNGRGEFTKAELALAANRWPNNRADNRDAYIFGTAAIASRLQDDVNLGNRGANYSLPDSGNYVMRSGNDDDARQINFTAGPKGGAHGHYNYMGFELWGYGRPLIADPGPYLYDNSANRAWAVSAAAHNTISVAGVNPAVLENNNQIMTSGLQSVAGGTMISATYQGYNFLDGQPVLSRSIWYDNNNTMVIVDFAQASAATTFQTGFTLEGQNTGRNLAEGTIYTKNASGGNVRIQSLLTGRNQAAHLKTDGIFTSPNAGDLTDPASRYFVDQTGTFAVFATVITAANGSAATQTNNVAWSRIPSKAGQSATLNVNGQAIEFLGPQFATVGANGQVKGTFNDVAYDSKGRLHMVCQDGQTKTLKYAMRSAKGVWGNIVTVDGQANVGGHPSLVIDSTDRPRVAYTDQGNGDLRYAYVSPETESWQVQTVDIKGSTGAYPSLALSRKGGPIIAYYNKTNGDLRVATSEVGGWVIQTIDSKGDVGRFPSLSIDPNRPTASKLAIAYESDSGGTLKYAVQAGSGYKIETADADTLGGYVSMKFYDAGDTFEPVVTYYDARKGNLRYATRSGGTWSNTVIASRKRQGLYSQLEIVNNRPRVFFYDGYRDQALTLSANKVVRGTWTGSVLGSGGREIHAAFNGRGFAYSNYDEKAGYLSVGTL